MNELETANDADNKCFTLPYGCQQFKFIYLFIHFTIKFL